MQSGIHLIADSGFSVAKFAMEDGNPAGGRFTGCTETERENLTELFSDNCKRSGSNIGFPVLECKTPRLGRGTVVNGNKCITL